MNIETLKAVQERLAACGIPASLEYPGFIRISTPGTAFLQFGGANETFGGEMVDQFDHQSFVEYESEIPSASEDVERLTNFVRCVYTAVLEDHGSEFEVAQEGSAPVALKSRCAIADSVLGGSL